MKKLWVLLLVSFLWTVSCSPKPDIKKLTQQANQGDASAQYNLGLMYRKGEGVPQDDVEGVKWYRLAADQGAAYAQYNLGLMYEKGTGVPQDYVQAHKWYNLAAAQGDSDGAENRNLVAKQMTPQQIERAQELARHGFRWKYYTLLAR